MLPYYVTRYGRNCSVYSDFLQHHILLSTKLLSQVLLTNVLLCLPKMFFRNISTPSRKVFCHLHTYDECRFWFKVDYCSLKFAPKDY